MTRGSCSISDLRVVPADAALSKPPRFRKAVDRVIWPGAVWHCPPICVALADMAPQRPNASDRGLATLRPTPHGGGPSVGLGRRNGQRPGRHRGRQPTDRALRHLRDPAQSSVTGMLGSGRSVGGGTSASITTTRGSCRSARCFAIFAFALSPEEFAAYAEMSQLELQRYDRVRDAQAAIAVAGATMVVEARPK
jgi:hypothetical protein